MAEKNYTLTFKGGGTLTLQAEDLDVVGNGSVVVARSKGDYVGAFPIDSLSSIVEEERVIKKKKSGDRLA